MVFHKWCCSGLRFITLCLCTRFNLQHNTPSLMCNGWHWPSSQTLQIVINGLCMFYKQCGFCHHIFACVIMQTAQNACNLFVISNTPNLMCNMDDVAVGLCVFHKQCGFRQSHCCAMDGIVHHHKTMLIAINGLCMFHKQCGFCHHIVACAMMQTRKNV